MKIPEMAWITHKLYIVVFVSLFYHSKRLYLLFTHPFTWRIKSLLLLWLDLWIFCAKAPSGVQYERKDITPPGFTDKAWTES